MPLVLPEAVLITEADAKSYLKKLHSFPKSRIDLLSAPCTGAAITRNSGCYSEELQLWLEIYKKKNRNVLYVTSDVKQ